MSGSLDSMTSKFSDITTRAGAPHQSKTESTKRIAEELEEIRVVIEETRVVAQVLAAVLDRFTDETVLQPDGNNLAQWKRDIFPIAEVLLGNWSFFEKTSTNSVMEKIGKDIFIGSVHLVLRSAPQPISSCYEIYKAILKNFCPKNSISAYNLWQRLANFDMNEGKNGVVIAMNMLDIIEELQSTDVTMNQDSVLGFMLQAAIAKSSLPFKTDFESRVEQGVQSGADTAAPSFDSMIHQYNISRRTHKCKESTFGLQTEVLHASRDNKVKRPDRDDHPQPENDQYDMNGFNSPVRWNCQSPDHFLSACPSR